MSGREDPPRAPAPPPSAAAAPPTAVPPAAAPAAPPAAPKAPEGRFQLKLGSFFKPQSTATAEDVERNMERAKQQVLADKERLEKAIEERAELEEEWKKKKRKPGRPKKDPFAAGTARKDATPSLGVVANKLGKEKARTKRLSSKRRVPKSNWYHPAVFLPIVETVQRKGGYRPAVEELKADRRSIYGRLSESTVRGFYEKGSFTRLKESTKKSMAEKTSFTRPNNGRTAVPKDHPEVQQELVDRLLGLRQTGITVNRSTARCVITAIIQERKPQLLDKFYVSLMWISNFVHKHLGWSYRRSTTAAQKLPADHEQKVEDMMLRLAFKVGNFDIPEELVFMMDETFFFFVPMGGASTFEVKGCKDVPVVGADDKRRGTVLLTNDAKGNMLPYQVLYQGSTSVCEPGGARKTGQHVPLPARVEADAAGHDVYHTPSHWCTQDSMKRYIERILVPARSKAIAELNATRPENEQMAAETQACVLIMDVYKVHIAAEFLSWLKEKHPFIHVILVLAGCTGIAQVPDLILNRPLKAFIRAMYEKWATGLMRGEIQSGKSAADNKIDLSLSAIKPLSLEWLNGGRTHLVGHKASIACVVEKVGYKAAWTRAKQQQAAAQVTRLFPAREQETAEAASAAAETDLEGVEADMGGTDEDEIPPAELVQRLVQVPRGQQLPAQLMANDEGEGVWDNGVSEQAEQEGLIAHARKLKDDLRMTDEQLAGMMRPRTRSRTKAARTEAASAAMQASTSKARTSKARTRKQASNSDSDGSSEEESSSEEGSSGEGSSGEGSSGEGSSGEGSSDEE